MERYEIIGGKKLYGEVEIDSAKNSVLPIIAASALVDGDVFINKCPKINDVICLVDILKSIGAKAEFINGGLKINCDSLNNCEIGKDLAGELRASVCMLGALLSRFKKVKIAYPGGCSIGKRPIDIHVKCLKALGATVLEEDGYVECCANSLKGANITLDYPSVGATENAILASVFAQGETVIFNCAREPEIKDFVDFLVKAGAKIYGAGTSVVSVVGVKRLKGVEFTPMSDRIEAGTFLIATAVSGGEICLKNCDFKNILNLINKLANYTCKITKFNDIIYIQSGKGGKPFSFSTGPYPLFPTDLQPQASVLSCVSSGRSVISERVFENRFSHFEYLKKMGAIVDLDGSVAHVYGVRRLAGAHVCANDLRGGAALVLAGLNAEGLTIVDGAHHVKRGYNNFDEKLRALGADIKLTEK